jgi:hypothetical protein
MVNASVNSTDKTIVANATKDSLENGAKTVRSVYAQTINLKRYRKMYLSAGSIKLSIFLSISSIFILYIVLPLFSLV